MLSVQGEEVIMLIRPVCREARGAGEESVSRAVIYEGMQLELLFSLIVGFFIAMEIKHILSSLEGFTSPLATWQKEGVFLRFHLLSIA